MNFRTPGHNRLTRGLFYEVAQDKGNSIYTLGREDIIIDGKKYKSILKLYLTIADPTEFDFANECFEDWDHWMLVCDVTSLQPHINKWRTELQAKIRSEAYKRLVSEALGGKNSYQANKYLVDGGYIDQSTLPSKRGRPKKKSLDEMESEAEMEKTVLEDLRRLGIGTQIENSGEE